MLWAELCSHKIRILKVQIPTVTLTESVAERLFLAYIRYFYSDASNKNHRADVFSTIETKIATLFFF